MSYEYMSGMGTLNITREDFQRLNEGRPSSVTAEQSAWMRDLSSAIGDLTGGITGGIAQTSGGGSARQRRELNRSCPSGSHQTSVDIPSGPGMSFARSREQALLDKGCTYHRTSSGSYIGSGATKYYCCPEQAAARPTQPSAVAQVRQEAFQEAMLEQQARQAETERNAATAEPPVEAPVTNGNGNGTAITPAAAEEEKKYFGFTPKQLMLMGAGGVVLYMLAKK